MKPTQAEENRELMKSTAAPDTKQTAIRIKFAWAETRLKELHRCVTDGEKKGRYGQVKKKWTMLLLAGAVMLNLAACGGGNVDSGADAGKQETAQETESENAVQEDETPAGVKAAWESVPAIQPVADGDMVSYGPITMKLPEGYMVKDKNTSDGGFYATDALRSDYVPHIDFSNQMGSAAFSSNMRENIEEQTKKSLSELGAQFREITAYEESELGGYGVVRATIAYSYEGINLIDEMYQLYETTGESGKALLVEYYGKEDDEQHLAAAKAAMDTIALITGDYKEPELLTTVSDWENIFNSPADRMAIEGNSVKFGPLHIDLPEGYTVEDETAESPAFYGPDGVSNYIFNFTKDSYYLLSDREYVTSTFSEQYGQIGYENISLVALDPIEVSGRKGLRISFDMTYQGMEISQEVRAIFEDVDAVTTPVITGTYTGAVRQNGEGEALAAAMESIRID